MNDKFGDLNAPENYEQKCLCILCLDTSGSMSGSYSQRVNGSSPIDELNKGIQTFVNEISNDATLSDRLEIAFVEFNSDVSASEANLIHNINVPSYTAGGSTNMGEALQTAHALAKDRKAMYKRTCQPYYRPWVICITDGAPDNSREAEVAAKAIHNDNIQFLAVGVENADMAFLQNISSNLPAMKMDGLKFSDFFVWLSNSMSNVTKSQPEIGRAHV